MVNGDTMILKNRRAAITKAIQEWFENNPDKLNIDLARHFGVSEMTASRWHKGTNIPDVDLLPELADFLGIDLNTLFGVESNSDLTNEEKKIIEAYRTQENMRQAVKNVLSIKD